MAAGNTRKNVVAACLGRVAMLGMLVAAVQPVRAQEAAGHTHAHPVARRIDPQVVEAFRVMPIQEGGRIKPLDTFARFNLLKLHGKRSMRLEVNGEPVRISATEWLVTCLLYPDQAIHYPTFVCDNSEVITKIGLPTHDKRRDRYSYAELFPARDKLYELARQYSAIDGKERSHQQEMLVNLASNVSDFEYLLQYMLFARTTVRVDPAVFGMVTGDQREWLPSAYIEKLPELRRAATSESLPADSPSPAVMLSALQRQGAALHQYMGLCTMLKLFPPSDATVHAWLSPGGIIEEAYADGAEAVPEFRYLHLLEDLSAARDSVTELRRRAVELKDAVVADASARGEYAKVPLEVTYYKWNFFFWALFGFLVSFIFMAATWMLPKPAGVGGRMGVGGLRLVSYVALAVATAMLVAGITMRCIIRGRPPVTTLYETVLFITACAVLVCVVIEWMMRQRIAIGLAPILGVLGMFLANKYEVKEAVDTMPSLQAVLDTNFWLATHVTCITIGYAAALLAGAIGHLSVLGPVVRLRRNDRDFYRAVGGMVYGVLCFGLFFSFIGTMLGGVWANYSWGRFWGWDPKENGALMIVLWQLIVLHARLGGYVRDFGVAIMAIIGGCIVAFSWWGVNLLGVGLHSYGFTRGIWGALMLFWGIEVLVMVVAFIGKGRKPAPA